MQACSHALRHAINIKAGGTRGRRTDKRDCNGHTSSGARFCLSTVWTKLKFIFLLLDLNACTFRTNAQGLLAQYIRPSKRLKRNPGVCGVHVFAGVGQGKVLLWDYIDRRRWSGAVAAEMYKGPVEQCRERAYPDLSKRTILADNDPTGFRSKTGMKAKEEDSIKVLQIPVRSPQINLCD